MLFLQMLAMWAQRVFIKHSHLVMFETWLKLEAGNSSTWREIKAVELCLLSFKHVLKAYMLSELIFFYIKGCQYSIFYTNCS